MDYKQTLETLYNMLPDFQKVGADAYKPGLDRIAGFCSLLGDPQDKYVTVHVAGTNGKGSVSHMLASVLSAAGYRTGLYTSPHLRDFRERIRIDGEMIPEEAVTAFAGRWMADMERIGLSFFEATAAMAFDCFAGAGVEVAVIETGLGGRLDATNIITPKLSIITNIGLDHVEQLGNDIASVAREKAGIIKPGVPVVIGERDADTTPVFEEVAGGCGSELVFAEDVFAYTGRTEGNSQLGDECPAGSAVYLIKDKRDGSVKSYTLDLEGIYQRKNIITVLAAIDVLCRNGVVQLTEEAVGKGLATAALSTGLRGRWQVLGRHPLMVCDTGHNAHGIAQVVNQIAGQKYDRLFMVLGFVKDKDLSSILPLLPKNAYYIFTSPSVKRALPAGELASQANLHGLGGRTVDRVPDAVREAIALASKDDMIFIGGSTFTVADLEQI